MNARIEVERQPLEQLQDVITQAMNRIQANKETDLCHYLPHKNGGHLHHLGFGKLKNSRPADLLKMIQQYILEKETPEKVEVQSTKTQRKSKQLYEVKLGRTYLNQIVEVLRTTGNEHLIPKIDHRESLPKVQKLLIGVIKSKKIDHDLWDSYVRLVQEEKATAK